MNRYGTFFLLDPFKNHIFYERKRMKKLALFLTDVEIVLFCIILFHFLGDDCQSIATFFSNFS
jgi:hypothetical protein